MRPEDLSIINNCIFPAILGAKRFIDVTASSSHMGYYEAAVFQSLLSNLRPKCAIEVGTQNFCPGVLHPDESIRKQMWGGLGFALFLPTPRQHELEVKTTLQLMFEAAYRHSVYCISPKPTGPSTSGGPQRAASQTR
jgi:hypothetical protein